MHEITKKNLDLLARWTMDVSSTDHIIYTLESDLPADTEDVIAHIVSSSFGDLELRVHAESVQAVRPYLRAARLAGFNRVTKAPVEKQEMNQVWWTFRKPRSEDTFDVCELVVVLCLPAGDANASCRYVKVGEKTVPDMKLLCGDELAKWEAEHEATV